MLLHAASLCCILEIKEQMGRHHSFNKSFESLKNSRDVFYLIRWYIETNKLNQNSNGFHWKPNVFLLFSTQGSMLLLSPFNMYIVLTLTFLSHFRLFKVFDFSKTGSNWNALGKVEEKINWISSTNTSIYIYVVEPRY